MKDNHSKDVNPLEVKNAMLRMIYLGRNDSGQIFFHERIAGQFQITHEQVASLMKQLKHDNYVAYDIGKDETEEFTNQKNPTLTESGRQFVENGGYGGRLGLESQQHIDARETKKSIDRIAIIGSIIAGIGLFNSITQSYFQYRQADINEARLKYDTTHQKEQTKSSTSRADLTHDTIYTNDTVYLPDCRSYENIGSKHR